MDTVQGKKGFQPGAKEQRRVLKEEVAPSSCALLWDQGKKADNFKNELLQLDFEKSKSGLQQKKLAGSFYIKLALVSIVTISNVTFLPNPDTSVCFCFIDPRGSHECNHA